MTEDQYPGVDNVQHYTEGLLVGYRWYQHHHHRPQFEFGFGLTSYGTVTRDALADVVWRKDWREIGFCVKTPGRRPAGVVVQFWARHIGPAPRGYKELLTFSKLGQNEICQTVTYQQPQEWNTTKKKFEVVDFELYAGLGGYGDVERINPWQVVDAD